LRSEAERAAHAGCSWVVGVADVAVLSEQSFGGVQERRVVHPPRQSQTSAVPDFAKPVRTAG